MLTRSVCTRKRRSTHSPSSPTRYSMRPSSPDRIKLIAMSLIMQWLLATINASSSRLRNWTGCREKVSGMSRNLTPTWNLNATWIRKIVASINRWWKAMLLAAIGADPARRFNPSRFSGKLKSHARNSRWLWIATQIRSGISVLYQRHLCLHSYSIFPAVSASGMACPSLTWILRVFCLPGKILSHHCSSISHRWTTSPINCYKWSMWRNVSCWLALRVPSEGADRFSFSSSCPCFWFTFSLKWSSTLGIHRTCIHTPSQKEQVVVTMHSLFASMSVKFLLSRTIAKLSHSWSLHGVTMAQMFSASPSEQQLVTACGFGGLNRISTAGDVTDQLFFHEINSTLCLNIFWVRGYLYSSVASGLCIWRRSWANHSTGMRSLTSSTCTTSYPDTGTMHKVMSLRWPSQDAMLSVSTHEWNHSIWCTTVFILEDFSPPPTCLTWRSRIDCIQKKGTDYSKYRNLCDIKCNSIEESHHQEYFEYLTTELVTTGDQRYWYVPGSQSFYLYHTEHPVMVVTFSPAYTLLRLLITLGSIVAIWFGLSVSSLSVLHSHHQDHQVTLAQLDDLDTRLNEAIDQLYQLDIIFNPPRRLGGF